MANESQQCDYHKAITKIGWLHLYLTVLAMNIIINGELYKLWKNTHLPRLEKIINKEKINKQILREEISKSKVG